MNQYTSWYLPAKAGKTRGWFTERQAKIAATRVIRDDLSKTDQHAPITWDDVKEALLDTKIWTHLITTFIAYVIVLHLMMVVANFILPILA